LLVKGATLLDEKKGTSHGGSRRESSCFSISSGRGIENREWRAGPKGRFSLQRIHLTTARRGKEGKLLRKEYRQKEFHRGKIDRKTGQARGAGGKDWEDGPSERKGIEE